MFAGAAREAVFSNPEVIRRVNAEFVPVALKAWLMNNPTDDEEGRLYREIGRSKPAPQGICVANSSGKALDWALMFDDDKSMLAFLERGVKRFRDFPDAKKPVTTERYMRFPSMKLPNVNDTQDELPKSTSHARNEGCPANPTPRAGTVIAQVVGRALDAQGKPVADTVRQEHYVEDRFNVAVGMQESLARTVVNAGTSCFKIPASLARQFVNHAYLGQLDVSPQRAPDGGALKLCEFWAQRMSGNENGSILLRIAGKSEVAAAQDESRPDESNDGRRWEHSIKLTWEGFIEMKGARITRLLLAARGSEKLKWGSVFLKGGNDVSCLPGGHPIDLSCDVHYGIFGEPLAR